MTLRKLDAVSHKGCQINMRTATNRMFGVHLTDDKGLSVCKREGYYMTGTYKGDCDMLYCPEEFMCCKMIGN